MPALCFDKHNPNDVGDEVHEYTHAADALRYWAAARPMNAERAAEEDDERIPYEDEVENFMGFGQQ